MDGVHALADAPTLLDNLRGVGWAPFLLALALHLLKRAVRARAWQNILRASYPDAQIPYVWTLGACMSGLAVSIVSPVRGGELVRLALIKRRIDGACYPTLGATIAAESIFDVAVASFLVGTALCLGALPVPDGLPAGTLFGVALAACLLALAARLARSRFSALAAALRLGLAAFDDTRAYAVRVASWQALSWGLRFASIVCFLRAFGIEATLETALLVAAAQSVSTVLPFAAASAGAQQGLFFVLFAGTATTATILAFGVGMQAATLAANAMVGALALGLMLGSLRTPSSGLAIAYRSGLRLFERKT